MNRQQKNTANLLHAFLSVNAFANESKPFRGVLFLLRDKYWMAARLVHLDPYCSAQFFCKSILPANYNQKLG